MGAAKDYLALMEKAKAVGADVAVVLVAGGFIDGEEVSLHRITTREADLPTALVAIDAQLDNPAFQRYSTSVTKVKAALKARDEAEIEARLKAAISDMFRRDMLESVETPDLPPAEDEEMIDVELGDKTLAELR